MKTLTIGQDVLVMTPETFEFIVGRKYNEVDKK